jgi:hypothetical protein
MPRPILGKFSNNGPSHNGRKHPPADRGQPMVEIVIIIGIIAGIVSLLSNSAIWSCTVQGKIRA